LKSYGRRGKQYAKMNLTIKVSQPGKRPVTVEKEMMVPANAKMLKKLRKRAKEEGFEVS
jgi:hypothetical protein